MLHLRLATFLSVKSAIPRCCCSSSCTATYLITSRPTNDVFTYSAAQESHATASPVVFEHSAHRARSPSTRRRQKMSPRLRKSLNPLYLNNPSKTWEPACSEQPTLQAIFPQTRTLSPLAQHPLAATLSQHLPRLPHHQQPRNLHPQQTSWPRLSPIKSGSPPRHLRPPPSRRPNHAPPHRGLSNPLSHHHTTTST